MVGDRLARFVSGCCIVCRRNTAVYRSVVFFSLSLGRGKPMKIWIPREDERGIGK
jgi:hypothetical protein